MVSDKMVAWIIYEYMGMRRKADMNEWSYNFTLLCDVKMKRLNS
jgi:hypothetical protein